MRLRKKPWAEPEMRLDPKVLFQPDNMVGRWKELFGNSHPIHLEVGCGKGQFITEMALQNPQINFIAVDYQHEVLVYLLRRVNALGLANVRILPAQVEFLAHCFGKGEISEMYIQFCNPWPKVRHQKRRLTHPRHLTLYRTFLRESGWVHFKTDHEALYEDSLEYFAQCDFKAGYHTRDLHRDQKVFLLKTEYETKFTEKGMPIYYGAFQKTGD